MALGGEVFETLLFNPVSNFAVLNAAVSRRIKREPLGRLEVVNERGCIVPPNLLLRV